VVGATFALPGSDRDERDQQDDGDEDDAPHERVAATPEAANAQTQAVIVAAFPGA
jgi:hypothetical protein